MYLLDQFFERTVVISLARRSDRRAHCAAHLRQVGLANRPVWFDAVDGREHPPPHGWNSGPGAWGCCQSHIAVMEQALADRLESVLILEDDAVFSPHTADRLPAFMKAVPPDWGQIYLGGQHLWRPRPGPHTLVLRGRDVNRTHAYAAGRRELPAILSYLKAWRRRPPGALHHIDHQLGLAHRMGLWAVYCPRSWFAGQADEVSDIQHSAPALPLRWWHGQSHGLRLPLVAVPPDAKLSQEQASMLELPAGRPAALHSMGDAALSAMLFEIAAQAAESGRLPAWRTPPAGLRRLRRLWHNEIIPLRSAGSYIPHHS